MVDLQDTPRAIYEKDVILDRGGHGLGQVLEPAPVPPDGTTVAVEVTITFPVNGTYEVRFLR